MDLGSIKVLAFFLFFFLMIRPPPRSTLFPYPPLSRSIRRTGPVPADGQIQNDEVALPTIERPDCSAEPIQAGRRKGGVRLCGIVHVILHTSLRPDRSEEHTSELQSLAYLVCRLLLEKK